MYGPCLMQKSSINTYKASLSKRFLRYLADKVYPCVLHRLYKILANKMNLKMIQSLLEPHNKLATYPLAPLQVASEFRKKWQSGKRTRL